MRQKTETRGLDLDQRLSCTVSCDTYYPEVLRMFPNGLALAFPFKALTHLKLGMFSERR